MIETYCDAYSHTCHPTPTSTVAPIHHDKQLPHTGPVVTLGLLILAAVVLAAVGSLLVAVFRRR